MQRAQLVAVLDHHVLLGFPALAPHAVHGIVVSQVDVAVGRKALPHGFDGRAVVGIGGADEAVVAHPHALPGFLELGHDAVAVGLGTRAQLLRHALDLLAVLVGAGQKIRLVPARPVVARQRVGHRGGVESAQVGHSIHVVDRRGDVEMVGHPARLPLLPRFNDRSIRARCPPCSPLRFQRRVEE